MDTDHGQVQAPGVPPQPAAPPTNGLALASLILGIASFSVLVPPLLIGMWLVLEIVPLLTAPVGMILGIVALGKGRPRRALAVAGVIVSAAAVATLGIAVWIAFTNLHFGPSDEDEAPFAQGDQQAVCLTYLLFDDTEVNGDEGSRPPAQWRPHLACVGGHAAWGGKAKEIAQALASRPTHQEGM